MEQLDFKTFLSSREIQVKQAGEEDDVHLGDVRHVQIAVEITDINPCAGFFFGFTTRCILRRFAVFHESGGQRPQSMARLDRATAQQHLFVPNGQGSSDDLRIAVVNETATLTHMPVGDCRPNGTRWTTDAAQCVQ